jgi:hypothetical protein
MSVQVHGCEKSSRAHRFEVFHGSQVRRARRSGKVALAAGTSAKGMRSLRVPAIQGPSAFVDGFNAGIVCAACNRVEECRGRDGPG